MIRESGRNAPSGWLVLPILLILLVFCGYSFARAVVTQDIVGVIGWLLVEVVAAVCLGGFFVVNPNEGRVLQLFGDYRGTVRAPGLRWASPFLTKKAISLRVRNFESARLKVNDNDGNPIEIAAVVVW